MPFDFPASPVAGQEFTPSGGVTYVWNSPSWKVKKTSVPARTKLTAATTYFYVRQDGSDSNDGLTNDPSGAFLTWQAAYDNLCDKYDLGNRQAVIQKGEPSTTPTTYTAGIYFSKTVTGGGNLMVAGTYGDPSTCVIDVSSGGPAFSVGTPMGSVGLTITGFKIIGDYNDHISVTAAAAVSVNNIEFGTCQGAYNIVADKPGARVTLTNRKMSGQCLAHLRCVNGAYMNVTGHPTFAAGAQFSNYAQAAYNGEIAFFGISGAPPAVSGNKYLINPGGIFTGLNGDLTLLPGSNSGVMQTISQYDSIVGGVREQLTGSKLIYIRSTGDDTLNDGSISKPFKTIARAVQAAKTYDTKGYDIQITWYTAETFTEAVTVSGPLVGGGTLIFSGSGASSVWTSAGRTLYARDGAICKVQSLTMASTGDTGLLAEGAGTFISVGSNMSFGTVTSYHMWAYGGGRIEVRNNYSITGNAAAHVGAHVGGITDVSGVAITNSSGAKTITNFAIAASEGLVNATSLTFAGAGTYTGARYSAASGGGVFTNTGNVNYLPGSTAGTATAPGWYG